MFPNLQENGISCIQVKLNHIILLYFLLRFGDKNNEIHHRVLMLHINNFDLILNNKDLYIYIFFIQERDLKYSCKGGEKNILT